MTARVTRACPVSYTHQCFHRSPPASTKEIISPQVMCWFAQSIVCNCIAVLVILMQTWPHIQKDRALSVSCSYTNSHTLHASYAQLSSYFARHAYVHTRFVPSSYRSACSAKLIKHVNHGLSHVVDGHLQAVIDLSTCLAAKVPHILDEKKCELL